MGAFLEHPYHLISFTRDIFQFLRGPRNPQTPPGLGLWFLGQQQLPVTPCSPNSAQLSPFLGKALEEFAAQLLQRDGRLSHWTADKIYEVHKWSSLETAQEWFELCPRSFIRRNAGLQGHGHKGRAVPAAPFLPWCHQHFAPS